MYGWPSYPLALGCFTACCKFALADASCVLAQITGKKEYGALFKLDQEEQAAQYALAMRERQDAELAAAQEGGQHAEDASAEGGRSSEEDQD